MLLLLLATLAAAQQMSEDRLRFSVRQFYQLQIDKKWREAADLVALDSNDDYWNSKKPQFRSVSIDQVELGEDKAHAKVTVTEKSFIRPDLVKVTSWKSENGEWRCACRTEANE